ncbi:MAG: T9SS type A sorting domain-containing protein [Bacteroidia bacterium]|nr:T9SS type A sorting domain-containing protein [Bacteroidia bacterium]MDW8157893.1 T9SS type A sorting domain-containing protein [Bacteroidia bacterium]
MLLRLEWANSQAIAKSIAARSDSSVVIKPVQIHFQFKYPDCSNVRQVKARINAEVTGGMPPYNLLWSNCSKKYYLEDVDTGSYSLTVTDAIGSRATAKVTLPPLEPLQVGVIKKNASSKEGGSIYLQISGGLKPYTIRWANGKTSFHISDLSPGRYLFEIQDARGCTFRDWVHIEAEDVITVKAQIKDVTCKGKNDGAIVLTVSGGYPPYTFEWSNGAKTKDLNNISPGTYTVIIRDSEGFEKKATYIVNEPKTGLAVTIVASGGGCNANDLGAVVNVGGGTPPFSYKWSNGQNTKTLSAVAPGTYQVTVTDATGCSATASINLTVQPPMQVAIDAVPVTCFGANNGKLDVKVNGGVPPFTYQWAHGSTMEDLFNVPPGNYKVTVTDSRGCSASVAAIIDQPQELQIDTRVQNPSCYDFNDGKIEISPRGGKTPYRYQWSNGSTSKDLLSLKAGEYTVVITDANNCTLSRSFSLSQPPAFSLEITKTDPLCSGSNNGSAIANVKGGVAPFKYQWSNGQTTPEITRLGSGTYTITVYDANGCKTTGSVTLIDPPPLQAQPITTAVSCAEQNNGRIEINATGGKPPYTYQWADGRQGRVLSNLSQGNYECTIIDSYGCRVTTTISLKGNTPIQINLKTKNPACANLNDGAIWATVTGGTGLYSYSWSNGSKEKDIQQLKAGSYTLTVQDANGCTATASAVLNAPSPITATHTQQDIMCAGASTGSISLSVSGGTAPYSYKWSNGATTSTLHNLPAGSYVANITDANGCVAKYEVTIKQPPAMILSLKATPVSCAGLANGNITGEVKNGTPPYQWSFTGPKSGAPLSAGNLWLENLPAGEYKVTVTDANKCQQTQTVTIASPPAGEIKIQMHTKDAFCGPNEGEITAIAQGGTPPYTFEWSNGKIGEKVTNLSAGTYAVTVTDSRKCTATEKATIKQSAAINLAITTTHPSCSNLENGKLEATVSGGNPPYTYRWADGRNTSKLENLGGGSYTLMVIDAKGCSTTQKVVLTAPPPLKANIKEVQPSCTHTSDGRLEVQVSGGTPPYTYSWSTGASVAVLNDIRTGEYTVTVTDAKKCEITLKTTLAAPPPINLEFVTQNPPCPERKEGRISLKIIGGSGPFRFSWSNGAVSQNIEKLGAGTYSVTVLDNKGCNASGQATLVAPPPIQIKLQAQHPTCNLPNQGQIIATVSGGTPPYTYLWSNGATTKDVTNLQAGSYSLTVTDANQCQSVANVDILGAPQITVTLTAVPSKCAISNDSKITSKVENAAPPVSYIWSNGAKVPELNGVGSGTYSLTVTDSRGCRATTATTLQNPPPLVVKISTTHPTCSDRKDGKLISAVSGGTPPYAYRWSNGSTTPELIDMAEGNYSLVVTDKNGCSEKASTTLSAPTPISIEGVIVPPSCLGSDDGKIELKVKGGFPPYRYTWSNGKADPLLVGAAPGNYKVIVTDANGCTGTANFSIASPTPFSAKIEVIQPNCRTGAKDGKLIVIPEGGTPPFSQQWSTGATTRELQDLASGTYAVTVTDAKGCKARAEATILPPEFPEVTVSGKDPSCSDKKDGKVTLSVSKGVAPYAYTWSTGATTSYLENIGAGSYSVTVTDAKGCATRQEVILHSPSPLMVELESTPPRCPNFRDGSIRAKVSGGVAPYTYKWNIGAKEAELSNLAVGEYSLVVIDSKQCTAQAQVKLVAPAAMVVGIETKLPKCNTADAVAFLEAKVSGGKPPYTYAWSTGENTSTLQNVKEGSYSLVVTDAVGCTQSFTTHLTFPAPLKVKFISTLPPCAEGQGKSEGRVSTTVTGGQSPYTYRWSNGQNKPEVELAAGEHTLTIFDANGCQISEKIKISRVSPIELNLIATEAGCGPGRGAKITVQINNGTPPFTYKWSNGSNAAEIRDIAPGAYSLTVIDANGCQVSTSTEIKAPPPLVLKLQTRMPTCAKSMDGEIKVIVEGGQAPFSYVWSNGVKDQPMLTNLKEGTYRIEVTDLRGCQAQKEVVLKSESNIELDLISTPQTCAGYNDGSIEAIVKGGKEPFSFEWSNGAKAAKQGSLAPGEYFVKVTDAKGCIAEAKAQVKAAIPFSVKLNVGEWVCASGTYTLVTSIKPTISGGQPPFSYFWSTQATSPELNSVPSGEYTLVVTDKNGCQAKDKISLLAPPVLNVTLNVTQPGCKPEESGWVEAKVSGGQPPYTYIWSNGKEGPIIKNIAPGELLLTVTDKRGCQVKASAIIVAANQIVLTPKIQSAVCSGQKHENSLSVEVKGGVAPYRYIWSNGANTPTIKDIEPGTYTVTVIDAKGCQAQSSLTLPSPIPFSATAITRPPSCADKNDGEIKIDVQGGTPPYSYQWAHNPKEPSLTNLAAGNYSVIVTDSKGCTTQVKVNLLAPAPLSIDFINKQPSCGKKKDGSILAKASGGTPPYTYSWSNNVWGASNENLEAGEYIVIVTDKNGCTLKKTVTLSQPASVTLTIVANTPKCAGQEAASIEVSAIGGMQPYSYRWSNGATTKQLTGLSSGEYTVTVTDANGCVATDKINIKIPEKIEIEFEAESPRCVNSKDGKIKAVVKGGVPPFSYRWSTGANEETLLNIGAGTFSLTVTDANSCMAQAAYVVKAPQPISVQLQVRTPCCGEDGQIMALVNGGTAPYQYIWSNGATSSSIEKLSGGEFTLTVKDANGCSASQKASVPNVKVPSIEVKGSTTLCPGQVLELDAGAQFASFKWSTGETSRVISVKEAGSYSVEVQKEACICKLGPIIVQSVQGPTKPTISQSQDTLISSPASSYEWFCNNIPISNSNTRRIKADKAGQYTVRITDLYGCSAISESYNYKPPLPESEIPAPELTIYPNPNNGQFRLSISGLKLAVTVTIYDSKANVVYTKRIEANNELEEEVTLNNSKPGTYVLKVVSNSGRVLQEARIVVH